MPSKVSLNSAFCAFSAFVLPKKPALGPTDFSGVPFLVKIFWLNIRNPAISSKVKSSLRLWLNFKRVKAVITSSSSVNTSNKIVLAISKLGNKGAITAIKEVNSTKTRFCNELFNCSSEL